ncbi:LysR family regulatory protein CidR [Lachnospiraceae bacterium TWA4]|nr:LysR family regulatory protein CidR [Lachnospiraceae bacterium TWA4]
MNLRDMECFIEVCKYNSINYTAEQLYLSPQGLSNIIKRLENELGVKLFNRTQSGLRITDYGEVFLAKSKKMLEDYQNVLTEIESLKIQKNGLVKLSSAFGVLRYLKPEFITNFHICFPDLNLDYIELPDLFVEEYIETSKADIGITPSPNSDLFDEIPLFSTPISFITHDKSRFYDRQSVSLKEIVEEPLILESENFRINKIIMSKFKNIDVVPNIFFLTSGFSLCYKVCNQNLANTVTTDFIFNDMRYPNMRMIPFEEDLHWDVSMILRKNMVLTDTIEAFIEYTKNTCREQGLSMNN